MPTTSSSSSRSHAAEAPTWTRQVMIPLGLTLNVAKTSVRDAWQECFDFLGYTFGARRSTTDGHRYLGASLSKRSVQRLKARVGEVPVPGNQTLWPDVCARLNGLLQGWSAYFTHGTRRAAYRAIDNHVYQNVRYFLIRRHKISTRGITRFPAVAMFGKLGVLWLRRAHLGAPPCA